MYILIIGSIKDPQVKKVYDKLNDLGVKVIVFDIYDPTHAVSLNLNNHNIESFIEGYPNNKVKFREIKIVWWRFKSIHCSHDTSPKQLLHNNFKLNEWREIFSSLAFYLNNAFWVNDFWKQNYIKNKPKQLEIAKELGFNIPNTIITNNLTSLSELLFKQNSKAIFKTLSSPRISDEEIIHTTMVKKDDVHKANANTLDEPKIYQDFIEKDYELRVTVIDNKLFAVRIDVSKDGAAYTDWKKAKMEDIYSSCSLDPKLESLIRAFHSKIELVIATYDIICSTNGKYYFLECNPAGQWLWIEQKLGIPITEEFAGFLSKKYKS